MTACLIQRDKNTSTYWLKRGALKSRIASLGSICSFLDMRPAPCGSCTELPRWTKRCRMLWAEDCQLTPKHAEQPGRGHCPVCSLFMRVAILRRVCSPNMENITNLNDARFYKPTEHKKRVELTRKVWGLGTSKRSRESIDNFCAYRWLSDRNFSSR